MLLLMFPSPPAKRRRRRRQWLSVAELLCSHQQLFITSHPGSLFHSLAPFNLSVPLLSLSFSCAPWLFSPLSHSLLLFSLLIFYFCLWALTPFSSSSSVLGYYSISPSYTSPTHLVFIFYICFSPHPSFLSFPFSPFLLFVYPSSSQVPFLFPRLIPRCSWSFLPLFSAAFTFTSFCFSLSLSVLFLRSCCLPLPIIAPFWYSSLPPLLHTPSIPLSFLSLSLSFSLTLSDSFSFYFFSFSCSDLFFHTFSFSSTTPSLLFHPSFFLRSLSSFFFLPSFVWSFLSLILSLYIFSSSLIWSLVSVFYYSPLFLVLSFSLLHLFISSSCWFISISSTPLYPSSLPTPFLLPSLVPFLLISPLLLSSSSYDLPHLHLPFLFLLIQLLSFFISGLVPSLLPFLLFLSFSLCRLLSSLF